MSCSQCGHDFGPGDHGYLSCDSHEKCERVRKAWDEIANQDNVSDEEALHIVANRARVTYGEAREVLCGLILAEGLK